MKTFSELIELSKTFGLRFRLDRIGDAEFLKLSNHWHPFSLTETEGRLVYDYIIQNNLKNGYEIATAFGVSSCVIGQALKVTNGTLVSMDSYIEDYIGNSQEYNENDRPQLEPENSDCYRMANKLIESLGLSEHVKLEIGWSPEDTTSVIQKHFTSKLDFCFIDGGHSEEQIDKDVRSVMKHMNEKCVLFFHDYQCMGEKTKTFLSDVGFNNAESLGTTFNLIIHKRQ